MSRRFGRNQRRKMREELAAAIADSNWHQSRASDLQNELYATERRLGEVQRQLNVAKACLGENHPAFPAGCFDPGYIPEPEDQFMIAGPGGVPLESTVMRFGTPRRNDFRNEIHFMLYAGKECAGYALTNEALHSMPRDVLAYRMTQQLVGLLLETMNKEPRR